MKKTNLFITALLSLGLMLAGCSNKGTTPSSSEPTSSETAPVIQSIAVSGEFKTEYEIGEEFDATGIVVTATYDKGEPKDVTADTVFSGFDSSVAGPIVVTATYLEKTAEINLTVIEHVYSAEEVVADINGVFNPLVGSDILAWYEDYSCYIGGLNLGAAEHTEDEQHAAELQSAAEFIASYLPEYLTVDTAAFEELEDDYYIGLSIGSVGVDIFGYINGSGNIIVQIQVAELVA